MLYCSNDTLFEMQPHVDSRTTRSNSVLEAHTTLKLTQNLTFLKLIIIIPSKVYVTLFFRMMPVNKRKLPTDFTLECLILHFRPFALPQ